MLNVRAQISILLSLSLVLAACGGGAAGKKVKINKGNRGRAVSDWVKDVVYEEKVSTPVTTNTQGRPGTTPTTSHVITTSLSCLSLPKLVDSMSAKAAINSDADRREAISINVFDLDFVTVQPEAVRGTTRTTIKSETSTDALQMQKANYFFQVRKNEMLSDMVQAKGLRDSALGAKLLNVVSQEKCSSVVLSEIVTEADGRQVARPVSYNIIEKNNRRVVLQKTLGGVPQNEYRDYRIDNRTQIRISLVKQVSAIPACGMASNTTHFVREEYLFARSRDLDRSQVSKNLALLFANFVFSATEIEEQIDPAKAPQIKGKGARRFIARERVTMSGSTFGHLLNMVYTGNGAKNLACSPKSP